VDRALATGARQGPAAGFPAVDIYGSAEGIAVLAELPGVEKEDLDIQAHRDTLTIRGTRRPVADKDATFHRHERRAGSFSRTIQLPFAVDPARVEASLENGVLRLSLPRPEEEKPRRIAIG
jgi:HSP20 family protein